MRNGPLLLIVGMIGCVGISGCCQSGTSGQGSRLCLLPGFLRPRNVSATIPTSSMASPSIEKNRTQLIPENDKPARPEKLPPRMPPVTELPVAPSLPQRLVPPPRVPVDTPTRSKLPVLIRPSELPTLPPLVTPPEANAKPMPVEGSLVIPTDHIVSPPGLPEIQQTGGADKTAPASAALVKDCVGEEILRDLLREKGLKTRTSVATSPSPAKKSNPVAVLPESASRTRTLAGKVLPWRGSWILRYAEIDAIDEHGGSVVLFGGPELDRLRDGQHVTVQGELIPAELRHESARFRVSRIVEQK